VLDLPDGEEFTVRAENLSDANRYIGRVLLNGKPLTRSYITDAEIRDGGELVFVMQATPNKQWASAVENRPYSLTGYGVQ
jgi:putative alpha-1,2-mannosidase